MPVIDTITEEREGTGFDVTLLSYTYEVELQATKSAPYHRAVPAKVYCRS